MVHTRKASQREEVEEFQKEVVQSSAFWMMVFKQNLAVSFFLFGRICARRQCKMTKIVVFFVERTFISLGACSFGVRNKAGESRSWAPGQTSDYALPAPNPPDSSAMTRCFIKISAPQTSPGPRYFASPAPPSRRPWSGNMYHLMHD